MTESEIEAAVAKVVAEKMDGDVLEVNGRMSKSRRIVLAGLDDQSRSVIESCLPNEQFKVTQVAPESGNETDEQVVLVVFTATDDVRQVRQLCASMRNRFGQSVPLLTCVGRYVFPAIRPPLETELQGLNMTPFDAREFSEKLHQMELGF